MHLNEGKHAIAAKRAAHCFNRLADGFGISVEDNKSADT